RPDPLRRPGAGGRLRAPGVRAAGRPGHRDGRRGRPRDQPGVAPGVERGHDGAVPRAHVPRRSLLPADVASERAGGDPGRPRTHPVRRVVRPDPGLELRRAALLLWTMVRLGAAPALRALFRLPPRGPSVAVRVRMGLERLGMTYLKLGQYL